MSPNVAVVKGERGVEPVLRALDLVDFKDALKGWDRVLIKVNFITTKTWDTGATTDPLVVEALIQRLQELPMEVFVVESDATVTNADKAFIATGMRDLCFKYDVEFINLRHAPDQIKIDIPDPLTLGSIKVPRIVTESAIISAAKMKTHSETGVTLGLKNMFGILPQKFKGRFHMKGMHKVITDINSVKTRVFDTPTFDLSPGKLIDFYLSAVSTDGGEAFSPAFPFKYTGKPFIISVRSKK